MDKKEVDTQRVDNDENKMYRAEMIAESASKTGRNPVDTAGMDTDDEIWLSENPDCEDYILQVWADKKQEISKTKSQ